MIDLELLVFWAIRMLLVHFLYNSKQCNSHKGVNIRHIITNNSGVGGIRTLVQTRKPFAFYMLSFTLIVGKENG
jgi:hypothetical protein